MNSSDPALSRRCVWRLALGGFGAIVALVFLLPGDLYLSAPGTDLTGQFIAWRAFAADSIRAGHFPLWNPYTYGGQPFLGDFQSAEFYPLNVIFLFLPMARAVNLSFLLHLYILAWGVAYWGRQRGWHPLACALAGFTAALSGPVFPHLYGGHLSNISSLAWAPWILAFLERAWQGPARRPLLLAAACIGLQILGGHVQYCFYTGIAAGLYALRQMVCEREQRWRALPLVAAAYAMGAVLVAAQLLPGFSAVGESVRQGKLDFNFVSMFSFPPENLLTLFSSSFFGGMTVESYWGRAYLWEVSVFIGASGVILAALALFDHERRRLARWDLAVAAILFLLALGSHTPLLRFLYDYVPGFGLFRSQAKFTFPATLFILLVVGAGADALVRGRSATRVFAYSVLSAGVCLLGVGLLLFFQPESIAGLRAFISNSGEGYLGQPGFPPAPSLAVLGRGSAYALLLTGVVVTAGGASLRWMVRWPQLRWVLLILLSAEMMGFAWSSLGLAHDVDVVPQVVSDYIAKNPGDYRVLDTERTNEGYLLGAPDIWGNDPTVLRRYAEFITFAQDKDPSHATQYIGFKFLPPIFSIIRFRMAIMHTGGANYSVTDNPGALPRAVLVPDYRVLPGRDAIFAELFRKGFDPRQQVLLETAPPFPPQSSAEVAASPVTVTELNSDALEIEADTPVPAILLITDLYSHDWHAHPLLGSSQANYEVQPGDYILRAIPVAAGHHHLMVEYQPARLRSGLIISAIAWLVWVMLMVLRLGIREKQHS